MKTRLTLFLAAFGLIAGTAVSDFVDQPEVDATPDLTEQAEPAFDEAAFDEAISEPVPVAPSARLVTEGEAPRSERVDTEQETLSVDFPNEEIRTVLRNVADLFELNLVVPDTLVGRTSIKLRDVTWRQIFRVVLTPVGYDFVEEDNIIKVISQEQLRAEPPRTEVFILGYARAADVAPVLSSMVDSGAGGRVQVDNRSNSLVVTERPTRLDRIRPIIEQLDKPTAQVMIESKFIETTNRDVHNIGVNWASLSGYNVSAGPANRTYLRETTQERIDSPLPTPFNALDNLTRTQRLSSAVFNASEFEVILSALTTQNETRLISNPTVVTLNNVQSMISIGEQFPVPRYTYNQERGTFEVTGFDYKDIGIILRVTPQVNHLGMINLKIDPEVSSRSGTTSFGGAGGAEIPIISTRRTSTQVSLKDGYTMALGGLIESVTSQASTKVPLLGDIPAVGRLFRSNSDREDSRNLLVFITARTLQPDGATYRDVFDPRVMRQMDVKESDLPGYRESSQAFESIDGDFSSPFEPEVEELATAPVRRFPVK